MRRRSRSRDLEGRRRFQGENLRKGIYVLPNLFTSASLFAGFYSIVHAVNGRFETSAWAIFVSALCDGADGRIARITHTTSRFGVEYDSLSDLVAFGVAPAILVYMWALKPFGNWGWSAAFLFVICGALRLARFNVQIDSIESVNFKGLPIPAAAGMVLTTVLLWYRLGCSGTPEHVAFPAMVFLLALLMVSNVKFVSFKDMELRKRKPFTLLLLLILLLMLVVAEPPIVLFTMAAIYVLHGPIRGLLLWGRGKEAAGSKAAEEPRTPGPSGEERQGDHFPLEQDKERDPPLLS